MKSVTTATQMTQLKRLLLNAGPEEPFQGLLVHHVSILVNLNHSVLDNIGWGIHVWVNIELRDFLAKIYL